MDGTMNEGSSVQCEAGKQMSKMPKCIFKYENVVEEEEVAGLEALAAHLQ
jgi:hypothetical protein